MTRQKTTELSGRELEVLRAVARGLSNKQIARQLDVAEPTVKSHLGRIFAKLDVQDRTQALIAGLKRGLISLE